MFLNRTLLLATLVVGCIGARAEEGAKADFFEARVRPVLLDRCAKCHDGTAESKSELSVLSRTALIEGGEYGPSILPGRAEDSLLVQAILKTHKELQMPPNEEDQLTPGEIEVLAKWITDGAVWPEQEDTPVSVAQSKGKSSISFDPEIDWALLPRKIEEPPAVADARWSKNPIDQFLEAVRVERGISANPRADRRTLIRRLTLDLIGLPPTPEEVEQFVNDPADETVAFCRQIDRLLASDRYGERQGRLWLDVARYADTQGDVGDYPIHTAYQYRNWVINALNQDLGYDEFLRAQIAGDILAAEANNEEHARGLTAATMFVSLSRRFGNTKKDSIHLTIEDTLDTVGRGILGLTLRCARCHDHKFDPVSQQDYYALYGIFESTIYPWMGMSIEKSPSDLSPAIPSVEGRKRATEFWALITRLEYQINNHFRPWLKPTLTEYKNVSAELQRLKTEQAAKQDEEISALEARRQELLGYRGGKFRELMLHGLTWLKEEKKRLGKKPGIELVFAVGEGTPHDAKLHRRGNPANLGEVVARGYVTEIEGVAQQEIQTGSGRLQLAQWITDPAHPLTARVMVNRIWQQHFGRGLVTTPDNFGRRGTRPTHPQLLDWLAERFVTDGWSLKKLHRLILQSESYRLASTAGNGTAQTRDPENAWWWKFSRRRLDAESIRDSMLAVSGQLDLSQPGPHAIPPWYEKRYGLNGPFHQEPETNHRSVYLLTQRIYRHSQLDLFDGPDRNTSVSQRSSSNVPAQALFLMNSPFVQAQATALSKRISVDASAAETKIAQLYGLLFGRPVLAEERTELMSFVDRYQKTGGEGVDAWAALCRTLITSNEFFFID